MKPTNQHVTAFERALRRDRFTRRAAAVLMSNEALAVLALTALVFVLAAEAWKSGDWRAWALVYLAVVPLTINLGAYLRRIYEEW